MINYARMTPVYLSQMMDLKENDEKTWIMMMKSGFCVEKSKVTFTFIGADHGIEQENRSIKVMGGIKGISNSSINLDEYFLSTAEISNIITSFCDKFGISESEACKREITTNSQDQRTAGFEVTSLKSVTYSVHMVLILMQQCLQRAYHESATKERY